MTHLHDDIDIGGAVHTVVHGHEVRMVERRQLAQYFNLFHEDLRCLLDAFLGDHLYSHRLRRILRTNK